uniref:CCHC-type domain-containing protein n=1 Tax=Arundo donax TaxID=35708 RepID=A0A0A8ZV60_ARUDO
MDEAEVGGPVTRCSKCHDIGHRAKDCTADDAAGTSSTNTRGMGSLQTNSTLEDGYAL